MPGPPRVCAAMRAGTTADRSSNASTFRSSLHLLETKVDAIDGKVTVLDGRVTVLDGKIDALAGDVADTRERVARIEGHLMAPGSFTTGGLSPAAPDEPRPEGRSSDPDQRQAAG